MKHFQLIGRFWVLLVICLEIQACTNTDGFVYKIFDSGCWEYTDTISFDLHPSQAQEPMINLEVSFLPDYRYSNLYVKSILTAPSGNRQEFLLNDNVIDSTGNWLSESGSGMYIHVFEQGIPLQFSESGSYSVQLFQYMRDSSLCEIQAIRMW